MSAVTPATPTLVGGQPVTLLADAVDTSISFRSDYTLRYPTTPSGTAVPLYFRSEGPALGVAFDNTLTRQANVAVTFLLTRNMAITTMGGSPQNNGVLPIALLVRVYDAANIASAASTATIAPASVPHTSLTNYQSIAGFQVANGVANVSNCSTDGCAGSGAPANPTSVVLQATAVGPSVTFTESPFTQVQFYFLDTRFNEWVLIGFGSAPVVTVNTLRTFSWTIAFDPPSYLGASVPLRIVAIGVNGLGDGLASAVNSAITLTNP